MTLSFRYEPRRWASTIAERSHARALVVETFRLQLASTTPFAVEASSSRPSPLAKTTRAPVGRPDGSLATVGIVRSCGHTEPQRRRRRPALLRHRDDPARVRVRPGIGDVRERRRDCPFCPNAAPRAAARERAVVAASCAIRDSGRSYRDACRFAKAGRLGPIDAVGRWRCELRGCVTLAARTWRETYGSSPTAQLSCPGGT
jgi:hypothetical protein